MLSIRHASAIMQTITGAQSTQTIRIPLPYIIVVFLFNYRPLSPLDSYAETGECAVVKLVS